MDSGLSQSWYAGNPNDRTRLNPLPRNREYAFRGEWNQTEKIVWLWSAYNEMCLHCIEPVDDERVMVEGYGDLCDEIGDK